MQNDDDEFGCIDDKLLEDVAVGLVVGIAVAALMIYCVIKWSST